MKKGLALLLTAVLAMGCLMTGCGSSAKETAANDTEGETASTAETAGTEAAAGEDRQVQHLLLVLMQAFLRMAIRRMVSM